MTEAMPFLQKYDITFLRPPTIAEGLLLVLATKDNPRLCRGEKIAYGEGQSRQEKVSELE